MASFCISLRWVCYLLALVSVSYAWDSDDLEVFDVVEEVGENFYTLLGVPVDAPGNEIKKAFRQLSLKLHPDKNPAEDAEIQFRNLVSVYEVLKDPKKRAIYADVLENGLPDWKHAIYYYRRVRKMGLAEMSIILFVIITIGQYLVAWAAYFEKRYAIQEFINTKKKSLERKQKRGKIEHGTVEMLPDMLVSSIPRPSFACTLPVQIPKFIWFLLVQAPPLSYYWIKNYIQTRNEKVESECESSEEEKAPVVRERGPRRRKGGFQAPEVAPNQTSQPVVSNETRTKQNNHKAPAAPPIRGGLWTDDDFDDLIRLMKKFPAGTQDRWEKIGEAMRRAGSEVAHMAHKIKDEGFNPFRQADESEEPAMEVKKTKTRKVVEDTSDGGWSQIQQKALETALAKFPKGSASGDRWEKIAHCVPGKTKEECMIRYKHLADMVKKKKVHNPTDDDSSVCTSLEQDDDTSASISPSS